MHIAQVMGGVYLHVRTCARLDEPPLLYLGNGWMDCPETWFVVRHQLPKRFAQVKSGVHLRVRTCVPFSYLGNGWTVCAEIWCVVRDPLVMHLTQTNGGVHLHVHTRESLFRISETAGCTALNVGVWLWIN